MSGARIVDYRAGEGRITAQTFGLLFLLVAGHTMLETARDALFLSRLPARQLNLVYIGLAGLSLLLTTGTVALTRRFGQRKTLVCTLLVAAYATTLFYHLPTTPRAVLGLYLLSGCIGAVLTPQFWTLAAELFTVTEGRRLFGPIASGGVLGGVTGASVAAVVLAFTAVTTLLPVAAALFVGAAWLATTLAPDRADSSRRPNTEERDISDARPVDPATPAPSWRHSPLLFRLALLVAVSTAALLTVDYLFKSTAARLIPPADLGTFFARYYAVSNALALVVQLALAGRLVRRLGVIASLQVMPFLLLGGAIASIVTGGALLSVLALKGIDGSLRHSLNRVALELVYLPVPSSERARAKAFIDTVLVRVVQALMSALLFVLALQGVASPRMLAVLAASLIAVWLLLASSLALPYLNLFREALTDGEPGQTTGNLDLFSAGAVIETLSDADPTHVIAGMDLLASKGHLRLVPALILRHHSPAVLIHAVDLFGNSSRTDWFALGEELLAHADEDVRMAAVRALAKHDVADAIARATKDPSSAIQTYAVFQAALREVKEDLLEHPLVARITSVPGEWGDALRRGLLAAMTDSPDPRSTNVLLALAALRRSDAETPRDRTGASIASAIARAMSKIKDPRFIPVCIELLAERDGREAIREALVQMGEPAFAALVAALTDTETARRVLMQIPMAISRFGSQRACDVLVVRLFAETVGYLRFRVLRALGSLVAAEPEVQIPRVRIEALARSTLLVHLHTLSLMVALQPDGAPPSSAEAGKSSSGRLLFELLDDKAEQALDRAFRLLKIAHPREDIHRVHRAVRSGDRRARANAAEFVNNLLSRHDQLELRELMLIATDDVAAAEKAARARRLAGPAPESASEALAILARDLDDALAAVAAHHAMAVGDGSLQKEVALVLRERPVLASIASRFFDADAPRPSSALERSRV